MTLRFLTFDLDSDRRELRSGSVPVPVSPKAFDVLSYLVDHRDRMVPKAELMDMFWAANATEAALLKTISQLRKALGGDSGGAAAIRTHHGRGFRFVAPVTEVAETEPQTPPAGDLSPLAIGERRLVVVLCMQLSPSSLHRPEGRDGDANVNSFIMRARELVQRNEGTLLHMMIAGFTAVFGRDPPCDDAARRAVHCARDLAEIAAERLPEGWSVGLDSGVTGVGGNTDTGHWALPDDIERGASALAVRAPPGDIMLSAVVRAHLRNEIETVETPEGFRLLSIRGVRAGIPARPEKHPTRFVGRTAEMTFLAAQRDTLLEGAGQAVLLSGPPGIGKSRLVREFLGSLDPKTVRALKVQCLPALRNTPLAPIRSLLLAAAPRPPTGTIRDDVDAALYRELLDGHAPDAPETPTLSDHQRRQRSFALIDRVLHHMGRDKPLVICFEDIHWLDATSRDLLDVLLRRIDGKPIMAVLTTRPDDAPPPTETILNLSSLGYAECRALLRDVAGDAEIPTAVADTLIERAHGNPFFIEELALAAQAGGDPGVDLPTTVQAVIEMRIGALQLSHRMLVYVISVTGPPAPLPLVALLLGLTADEIEERAQELIRAGFLTADPTGLCFRHMLINDTAYAMVEPQDRMRLHADIAAYFETAPCAKPARPERLAWHYQEAGATERSISFWAAASRAALHRSARQEAVTFAENGLALIREDTPELAAHELDLLLCLAPALTALRGFGAAIVGTAYRRADRLNRKVGNPKSEIRVRVGLWIHTWVCGRLTESLAHSDALLAIAARIPDPALQLQAHASRGQVLMHLGALTQALHHLSTGLSAIEADPPTTLPAQNAAVSCAAYASWVAGMMGRYGDAERYLEQSKHLATLHENPFAEAIHYALCAETFMHTDDPEGCLAYADHAIRLSREHDFAFWLGTGLAMRGWALGRQGAFEPAEAAFDEGIAVFEATGAGVQLGNWYGLRAETFLAAGRVDDALSTAKHALACADSAGDIYFDPRIHAVAALALDRVGRTGEAEAHRREAEALANRFGMGRHVLSVVVPD